MLEHEELLPYVGYVLDTALSPDRGLNEIGPGAVLVGWQCGFEPMVVAVIDAYDGMPVDEDEAIDIARDYLRECNWFANPDDENEPDYVVTVPESD